MNKITIKILRKLGANICTECGRLLPSWYYNPESGHHSPDFMPICNKCRWKTWGREIGGARKKLKINK